MNQIRGYRNEKFGSLDMCYEFGTTSPPAMPKSCDGAKQFAMYKQMTTN